MATRTEWILAARKMRGGTRRGAKGGDHAARILEDLGHS
jgi:hypothetical protein